MENKHLIASKIIDVESALEKIAEFKRANIVIGLAPSEPQLVMGRLHEIHDRVDHIGVTTCLPIQEALYFSKEEYAKKFSMNGWFYTNAMRKSQKHGNISFIPNHLHLSEKKRSMHIDTDIFICACSPVDKHGFVSLSLSNVYERKSLDKAKLVILEVNENFPRTFGDVEVNINDVDFFVEASYDVPAIVDIEPNERDLAIGKLIAEHINDGDCIQLGIGGIPNAVAASLHDKKDLGIHTEMLTSGMVKLIKEGVITGKKKNFYRNKVVCAFAYGNKELYDFLDNNPSVLVMDGNFVNDPYIIGKNDNQVSINTTIEVDLVGQCASESIGHVQYSGTGGQADTAIGAQIAKNGKSFIALYSTAFVKNKTTGEREEISKIVPTLKPGAVVSLSRNDVDYVVTEYGVVSLRGTTVNERVKLLISIAHPKFRDELTSKAMEMGYIYE